VKRGEIRWYKFTHPDKKRPVLILTRNSVIDYIGEVTVAPITSRVRGIPSEVPLGRADGMAKDCAVNCDHLQTVSKDKVGALIVALPSVRLTEISQAVQFALGF